jgi:hypothetical protein
MRPVVDVSPDLTPLYDLEEAKYSRIINELANLIIQHLQILQDHNNTAAASHLAQQAARILANYDPDVADVVESVGFRQR